MRGDISATLWGDTIPMRENPHVYNPPQAYVASANQSVTDNTYPYWYNGDFSEFRSWEINYYLIHDFWSRGLNKNMVQKETYPKPWGLLRPDKITFPYEDSQPGLNDIAKNKLIVK
jgi:hypothetical protein